MGDLEGWGCLALKSHCVLGSGHQCRRISTSDVMKCIKQMTRIENPAEHSIKHRYSVTEISRWLILGDLTAPTVACARRCTVTTAVAVSPQRDAVPVVGDAPDRRT